MDVNINPQQTPIAGVIAPNPKKGKAWGKPWKKGETGNPGGRPKRLDNIVDIARNATPKAMRTLVAIMDNEKASFAVRAYCAEKVIERAYGKPVQQTNLLVGTTQRSLSQLSDAELLQIIEGSRVSVASALVTEGNQLPPPIIDQPQVEVEPSVEPNPLAEASPVLPQNGGK